MDDFQIVVYIILVVIYIISRALKAKKKAVPPQSGNPRIPQDIEEPGTEEIPEPYNPPVSQPVTFEDLLKEFTGYKEESEPARPESAVVKEIKETVVENPYLKYNQADYRKPAYQDYDSTEDIIHNAPVSYDDIYKGPEKMIEKDTEPEDVNEGRFDKYASFKEYDVHTAARFRKLLHNPMTVRDAVILKEILDRKYF